MTYKSLILAGLCAASPFTGSAFAQCQLQRLIAGDTVVNDEGFGGAIAMSGDCLIIGAKRARPATTSTGAAYIYRRAGSLWSFESKLGPTPNLGAPQFGTAVAIDGDVAIVGAPLDGQSGLAAGAAFIFRRTSGVWAQEAKLLAPDPLPGDRMGLAVAIRGDLAIVGVPFKSDLGIQAGCAYIYERIAGVWSSGVRLDFDNIDAAFFGSGVACAPGLVIVGAINKTVGTSLGQGAVYTFHRTGSTWTRDPMLTADDGAPGDNFGIFISLSGDALLVGSYLADGPAGEDQGAAYIFRAGRAGTFVQEAKLLADDAAPADSLGTSGCISGNTAIIGAYHANLPGGTAQGAAYIFTRSGSAWTQTKKLAASDPATDDGFGLSAAIDTGFIAVGAPSKDLSLINAGATYTFGPCTCYPNCDNSTAPPILNALDFGCFLTKFASSDTYANCDNSTNPPILNALDFGCFLTKFASGCT